MTPAAPICLAVLDVLHASPNGMYSGALFDRMTTDGWILAETAEAIRALDGAGCLAIERGKIALAPRTITCAACGKHGLHTYTGSMRDHDNVRFSLWTCVTCRSSRRYDYGDGS